MERTTTVCDVCQDPSRDTRRYTIIAPAQSVTVDLCDVDDEALRELTAKVAAPAVPEPKYGRGVAKVPAKKAPAEKAPAKRGAKVAGPPADK